MKRVIVLEEAAEDIVSARDFDNGIEPERFPFGIYYRETIDETQVFAILDLRMEPTWIREELQSRNP